MKVTFKDVGQGDSIILEWDEEGVTKAGIIDCNIKGDKAKKNNPVKDHIIEKGYQELAFIILSHPHDDHFSGMLELMNYIEEKGIVVQKVAHTLSLVDQIYWQYFQMDTTSENDLENIVQKWASLKKKGQVKTITTLSDGVEIVINKNIKIKCLAPSHDDIDLYKAIVQTKPEIDSSRYRHEASKAANFLSTILKISIGHTQILFTADAEKKTFQKIIERKEFDFPNNRFCVCQIPHHGSVKNHNNNFWDLIETLDPKYAVISAGEGYKHPSIIVVQNFHDRGYSVHCTNVINGMKTYIEAMKEMFSKSTDLDMTSVLADEYLKANDRIFSAQGENFFFEPNK